jgi:hypothetical protein
LGKSGFRAKGRNLLEKVEVGMKRWKAAAGSILAVMALALGMAILALTMAPKAEAGASENFQAQMLIVGLVAAKAALNAGCTYKAVWGAGGKTL